MTRNQLVIWAREIRIGLALYPRNYPPTTIASKFSIGPKESANTKYAFHTQLLDLLNKSIQSLRSEAGKHKELKGDSNRRELIEYLLVKRLELLCRDEPERELTSEEFKNSLKGYLL